MKYEITLIVTDTWRVSVEADSRDEAEEKAVDAYEACINPWDDEAFMHVTTTVEIEEAP